MLLPARGNSRYSGKTRAEERLILQYWGMTAFQETHGRRKRCDKILPLLYISPMYFNQIFMVSLFIQTAKGHRTSEEVYTKKGRDQNRRKGIKETDNDEKQRTKI